MSFVNIFGTAHAIIPGQLMDLSFLLSTIQTAMAQAAIAGSATQTSANTGNVDISNASIDELRGQLNTAGTKLEEISTTVDKVVADSAKETITRLEMAMTKIFKVAVFIRGDYDNREPDMPQKEYLLGQAVQSFQDVEDCSEAALKRICDFHAQVVEIENSIIIPVKDKISLLIEGNANTLQTIGKQLNEAQSTAETLQQSLVNQTCAVRTLQMNISEQQATKVASDVFFTVITLGIGNAINGGPLDPANLQGDLNEARGSLSNAQTALSNAQRDFQNLQVQFQSLNSRLYQERQVESFLPQLTSLSESTNSRCIMLQRLFAPYKETASKLLIKVREVQDGVLVTSALAYSKKEFALGLLEICGDCLIDSHLTDEAEMLRDEIVKEYGGPVSPEIEEATAVVNNRIEMIGTLPSVQKIE